MIEFVAVLKVVANDLIGSRQGNGRVLLRYLFGRRPSLERGDDGLQRNSRRFDVDQPIVSVTKGTV